MSGRGGELGAVDRGRMARYWDGQAERFDARIAGLERRLLADSRRWVGSRAEGATLELAIGTGLNLQYFAQRVDLTGIEWSRRMLDVARRRAGDLGLTPRLLVADAAHLPFPAETYDTVVCTFSLCCVPDVREVLGEAARVLRPGGALLIADHVVSTNPFLRFGQRALDLVTVPLQGEHFSRRPIVEVRELGFEIVASERLSHGAIERVHAVRTW